MCTMRIEECLRCPYTDTCDLDVLPEERAMQDRLDRELEIVEPEVLRRRETLRRYNRSDKGRLRSKKYLESEKGKQAQERRGRRRIENGKNAEYCRRYYHRQKALREAHHEQTDH
ncbi:hypothetical protein LQE92_08925 [Lacrimispora sp. NSJ-141]|uniref:Uncharacterized protein n=1 Tax=Lientehia hominis TaxID=2897778 RepID=A0AAP2RKR5_9FIRM|nr:hypothetical protein [Lientehia hominis]MCD2492750.1 hypothetical protein [Lientehia hominis]